MTACEAWVGHGDGHGNPVACGKPALPGQWWCAQHAPRPKNASRLHITADQVQPGDRIVGVQGQAPYPLVFVVGEIKDHNRGGRRLGPRFYPVNRKELGRLDFAADTMLEVER